MMEDRDLLNKAASLIGIDLSQYEWKLGSYWLFAGDATHSWNPLFRDEDAFRLMVKLRMSVDVDQYEQSSYAYTGEVPRVYSVVNWSEVRGDEAQATRRAIVQSAAYLWEESKC